MASGSRSCSLASYGADDADNVDLKIGAVHGTLWVSVIPLMHARASCTNGLHG